MVAALEMVVWSSVGRLLLLLDAKAVGEDWRVKVLSLKKRS